MSSSSSTKKTKEASKTDKDVLLENSSLTKDKHSKEDQTISDVEKEYSRASSITEDTILVIIQNLNGTFFTLNVTSSDSITKVKEMIKAKKGIDVYKYYLVCNGTELEDDKSASDYDIQHDSFIRMLPLIPQNVHFPVLNNSGKTIWMKVNENESIKNLKFKIQEECEIPLDKQSFTCFDERTPSNDNFAMEEISHGIKEVRNDIAEIKSDLEKNFGAIENEFGALEIESAGTSDVNNQDNVFDGHEYYQRSENESPADSDSENAATSDKEYDSSDNESDESEEPDSNKSSTEDDENDVNDQDNDFDGQESYHGDEDETPADNTVLISDEDDDLPNLNDESGTEEAENEANNPLPPSPDRSINQTKIINAEDYQIVYRKGKRTVKYLYVFDPVNKNLYYEYTWVKGRSGDYACNRCQTRKSSKKQTRVSAKEIGNNRIKLRGPQHCCQKKEYNIVKKSGYERVKEESKGDYARIFTTDDKSRYYDLTWNDEQKFFRCSPCHHYHSKAVTANLIFLNDENGEECIQMKSRQHSCTPKTVQN